MSNAKLAKSKAKRARASQRKRSVKARNFEPRDLYQLVPEFLYDQEDDAENLLRLERMLTRAQGFALAFARVNVPTQRAELVKEIRRRVEPQGISIIEIDFQAPVHDFLNELIRRLAKVYLTKVKSEPRQLAVADSAPRYAVFVYGLEHSIPSSETYHPVLSVINYKRENFRQHLAAPLVIWVPEYALQAIIEGAPDFWAWRSGVFEFVAPREEVLKTWLTIEPERGQIELSNMTLEEKRKRIHLLSGLLAEYEARENADTPEIMAIRFDLLDRLGKLYYFLGEYQHALEFHQRAFKIAEKSNHQKGVAGSLHHIGMIHQDRGDFAAALSEYQKSLKIKEELGDRAGVAASLHQIGMIHQERGDYATALSELEKSMKLKEELGDRAGMAYSLGQIGRIYHQRGQYDLALKNYETVKKISENLGDQASVSKALHHVGMIHQAREEYAAALAEYEKSLKIAEGLGDHAGVANSLHQIGRLHQDRGDYAAALAELEKSMRIKEELGDRAGVATSHGAMGRLFANIQRYPEAFEHSLQALLICLELESPNAKLAMEDLRNLRAKWGAENFDAAWQKATSEAVPEWLKA